MNRLEQTWDYEVDVTDLQTTDRFGNLVRNQKATVDKATGEILGIVSRKYNVVQNKTLYDTMQEIASELDLTLEDVQVCKNKSVTIFRYGFGETNNRVIGTSNLPKDEVKFGMELINTFDSRLGAPKFRAFAERLVCTNGMTMPKSVAQFTFRSLGDLTPDSVKARLRSNIGPVCETARIWENWAQTTPDRIKVGEFISCHFGKKISKYLLEQYDADDTKTIWTLYNLVTAYISHEAKSRDLSNLRIKQYDLNKIADKFYTESLV